MTTIGKSLLTALLPLSFIALSPKISLAQKTASTLPYPITLSYDDYNQGMASHRDTIMKVANGPCSLTSLSAPHKKDVLTLLSQTPQTPDNKLAFAMISDFMRQQTVHGFIRLYITLNQPPATAGEACSNQNTRLAFRYSNAEIQMIWNPKKAFQFSMDYPDNCSTCEEKGYLWTNDENPQDGNIKFSLLNPKNTTFPYSGLATREPNEFHPPKPTATSTLKLTPSNPVPTENNSLLNGLSPETIDALYRSWKKDKGNEAKTMRDFIIEMNAPKKPEPRA